MKDKYWLERSNKADDDDGEQEKIDKIDWRFILTFESCTDISIGT